MVPTHRLDVKDLERVPRDPDVCQELVRQSRTHRTSAAAIGSGLRCADRRPVRAPQRRAQPWASRQATHCSTSDRS